MYLKGLKVPRNVLGLDNYEAEGDALPKTTKDFKVAAITDPGNNPFKVRCMVLWVGFATARIDVDGRAWRCAAGPEQGSVTAVELHDAAGECPRHYDPSALLGRGGMTVVKPRQRYTSRL
jgi:hypothetical protein